MHTPQSEGRAGAMPIGLGAAALPGFVDTVTDAEAVATVEACLAAGITHFDVAPRYAAGRAERLLGRALRGVARNDFTISTKVGWRLTSDGGRAPDTTPEGVERSLADSAARLGIDRFDAVLIHDPDDFEDAAREVILPRLAELKRLGAVGAVGVGMNQWQMPARLLETHLLDVILVAGRYTLLEQGALPLLDLCRAEKVKLILGGIYNSGILASGTAQPSLYNYERPPPEIIAKVSGLERACMRHSVKLNAAALQFALADPAVSEVVIGMSAPEHVRSNLDAYDARIPDAFWREILDSNLVSREAALPTQDINDG